MRRTITTALLCAMFGTAVLAASTAEAQRFRDHRDDGGRVVAGVAGLAIGASLASRAAEDRDQWYRDNNRDPGYDDDFYRQRGFYPNDGYYASKYSGYAGCRVENRYDSHTGQPIQIRACE